MEPAGRRRIEPWPLGLVALLATMIGICIAFYHVASAHPDPVITVAPTPGLER